MRGAAKCLESRPQEAGLAHCRTNKTALFDRLSRCASTPLAHCVSCENGGGEGDDGAGGDGAGKSEDEGGAQGEGMC